MSEDLVLSMHCKLMEMNDIFPESEKWPILRNPNPYPTTKNDPKRPKFEGSSSIDYIGNGDPIQELYISPGYLAHGNSKNEAR